MALPLHASRRAIPRCQSEIARHVRASPSRSNSEASHDEVITCQTRRPPARCGLFADDSSRILRTKSPPPYRQWMSISTIGVAPAATAAADEGMPSTKLSSRCKTQSSMYTNAQHEQAIEKLQLFSGPGRRRLMKRPMLRSHILNSRSFCLSSTVYTSNDSLEHSIPETDMTATQNVAATESTEIPIREKLRDWQAANLDLEASSIPKLPGSDLVGLTFHVNKPKMAEVIEDDEIDDIPSFVFDKRDLVDFGNKRSFLFRGDLVEIRNSDGTRVELAIFVRELETQSQFYTMSGKWLHQQNVYVKFFVPGFVDPQEIDALLPYLPSADVPEGLQDELQKLENAPPKSAGFSLLQKMASFWNQADLAYRILSPRINNPHKFIALKDSVRYATMEEIAKELAPKTSDALNGFGMALYYAIHRALIDDPIGIRVSRIGIHRTFGQFEIVSMSEVNNLHEVVGEVRELQEYAVASVAKKPQLNMSASLKNLGNFIVRAQDMIDESRSSRLLTSHGAIGPDSGLGGPRKVLKRKIKINDQDKIYIDFIRTWTTVSTAESPTIQAAGSALLRATGRYKDLNLSRDTGWVFLQEIGAIAPWQTQIANNLRLPAGRDMDEWVKNNLPVEQSPSTKVAVDEAAFAKDMEDIRKDWEDLPVYCIDDVGAHEIDDGVSIESSNVPGEYWVHIHVADPASYIRPGSGIAKAAEYLTQTVYLPDRVFPMLPPQITKDRFSLAPDRPCLTFSARINSAGELLDQQIRAGLIRNVIYITPNTVAKILGTKSPLKDVTVVGTRSFAEEQDGTTQADELEDRHKEDLKKLASLGEARRATNSLSGAVLVTNPNISVKLHWPSHWYKTAGVFDESKLLHYDPRISLSVTRSAAEATAISLPVMNLMLLASEVVARWCHERGIPIIYRVSQQHPERASASDYFLRHILPYANAQETPPKDVISRYLRLLSPVLPSATAGPHLPLGVEMTTKCTSPLRRYSDLVVHWQVGAALLEEARSKESLIGSTRTDYLPFSQKQIDQLIPRLAVREKIIADSQRHAVRAWSLQLLLRAWKFNEAELPKTFELTTRLVRWARVSGDLNLFGLSATMDIRGPISKEDIREGDIFEVEIEDINIYWRMLKVKFLRRLEPKVENNL